MTTTFTPIAATRLPLAAPHSAEADRGASLGVVPALRRRMWQVVTAVSGGLTVTGRWQVSGGCVVVANHSSHADTAVLLAALPSKARPVFAAAADYWFDDPMRRCIATSLAGVLPVARTGGNAYAGLLAAARPALRAGRTVVIYPEGTRSTDGQVGEFRSGAVQLARDCAVPIVPVAVSGTAAVLPKNGHYRRGAMQVRIGAPVDPHRVSATALRTRVLELAGYPVPQPAFVTWGAA